MSILSVNPTRMELTSLKGKLATARRGHKLLKDKCDELMRSFMERIRENRALRAKVEEALSASLADLAAARGVAGGDVCDAALMLPRREIALSVTEKNVMSVHTPVFTVKETGKPTDVFSYGFAFTSGEMDEAIKKLSGLTEDLLRLAEIEKTCSMLAAEIERTRRRVNALEHVMIPDYEDTIRFITMKLDEAERSTTTRLMKVKDMMLQQGRV
ncbi:MAG: V-type ATP synthase subunit D [Clostridia bacterium]|nr:V-type ATP synthase subunit D [Clostridia bacterium]